MNTRKISIAVAFTLTILLQNFASASTVSCTIPAETYHHPPSHGKTRAYEYNNGLQRYLSQTFRWSNPTRHAWLTQNADSTFELDSLFYNYNRKSYAKSFSGTWYSNLPRKYLDTQSGDSEDEKAVTIGSAQAADIVTNRTYYYSGRLEHDGHPGNVYPDSSLKVLSQYGRRVPEWCHSTWCSFACESNTNNVRVLNFSEFGAAPGCKDWITDWHGGSSNVSSC